MRHERLPRILYPYHFGESDTGKLVELMKDVKEVECIRAKKILGGFVG